MNRAAYGGLLTDVDTVTRLEMASVDVAHGALSV